MFEYTSDRITKLLMRTLVGIAQTISTLAKAPYPPKVHLTPRFETSKTMFRMTKEML